jgi:hypothetical protein
MLQGSFKGASGVQDEGEREGGCMGIVLKKVLGQA